MISIDKAKQLKELGLKWEPKEGDWYKSDYWSTPIILDIFDEISQDDKNIWLPTLKQLLIKIEQYNKYFQIFNSGNKYGCGIGCGSKYFFADILEDAVADALIWILEEEQEAE